MNIIFNFWTFNLQNIEIVFSFFYTSRYKKLHVKACIFLLKDDLFVVSLSLNKSVYFFFSFQSLLIIYSKTVNLSVFNHITISTLCQVKWGRVCQNVKTKHFSNFFFLLCPLIINLARGDLFQHLGLEFSTAMFWLFVTVRVFKVTLADVGWSVPLRVVPEAWSLQYEWVWGAGEGRRHSKSMKRSRCWTEGFHFELPWVTRQRHKTQTGRRSLSLQSLVRFQRKQTCDRTEQAPV